MKYKKYLGLCIAGFCAGAVNGLFGAGGGMILVPLLGALTALEDRDIFSGSIAIILPICIVSLTATTFTTQIPWSASLPYLIASTAGGILAGMYGRRIPTLWLHRGLGALILWGGVRYLC